MFAIGESIQNLLGAFREEAELWWRVGWMKCGVLLSTIF
jgi:hypothetical protein